MQKVKVTYNSGTLTKVSMLMAYDKDTKFENHSQDVGSRIGVQLGSTQVQMTV